MKFVDNRNAHGIAMIEANENFCAGSKSFIKELVNSIDQILVDPDSLIWVGYSEDALTQFTLTHAELRFDFCIANVKTNKRFWIKIATQQGSRNGQAGYERLYKLLPWRNRIERECKGKFGIVMLTKDNEWGSSLNHDRFLNTLEEFDTEFGTSYFKDPLMYFYDNSHNALNSYAAVVCEYLEVETKNRPKRDDRIWKD